MQKHNRGNMQSLGVSPRNYVPDASKLDSDSWNGATRAGSHERKEMLPQVVHGRRSHMVDPMRSTVLKPPTHEGPA